MGDLNVVDRFLETFIRYIDGGFGLLGGDVAFLTTVLVGIDVTLAGLFWALDGERDVLARLCRKVLAVGAFAFILNDFATLADIVFRSFSALGLTASQSSLGAGDLLRPGRLAGIGFEAAWPLLEQAGSLIGFTTFFDNVVTIVILLFAWFVVILAFFVLAVQLFITILEYRLTALAGFVLVPFALWNRTAFLAERVLGAIVAAGVKVMVLAVIVGIGSNFFSAFIGALQGREPGLADAMSLVLASLALLGLGIFGPGIATGLVSGAPQLGAGAAAGTALAAGGVAAAGGMAATGAVAAAARLGAAGGRFTGALAVERQVARREELAREIRALGGNGGGASPGSGGGPIVPPPPPGPPSPSGPSGEAPGWARRLKHREAIRHGISAAVHTIRSGDHGGGSLSVPLSEEDRR
ncbi:P-type conjugative transfer protein TrbL [Inquilinus sp. Marseille-Q2685]|uniref:P-type conjugative transfer protein TrbL n=1 Tax=Inquilinus sp. Marseille-Q2685 TaxID=2866581 RepID=UPI001CE3E7C3|nr:P-type conjugative transfer protein TrbL [Inquilinus sp. Marseille-Q2685]